jgi:predicted nuclease of predicted toxin-antitoxin system
MPAFKVDENLPFEVVELLRTSGYDAMHVLDQRLGGHPDRRVADVCADEHRALITLDLDFADIRRYPPQEFHGLIVLRVRSQDVDHVISVLRRLIPLMTSESLSHRLWIVDEATLRVRPGED